MNPHIGNPMGSNKTAELIKIFQEQGIETAEEVQNEAETVQASLRLEVNENSFHGKLIQSQKLRPAQKPKIEKSERPKESILIRKEEADGLADSFSRREGNRQYYLNRNNLSQLLQNLGTKIRADSSNEEIIATILEILSLAGEPPPDVSQVDKAFEFLLEVLQSKLQSAKSPESQKQFQQLVNQILNAKSVHYEKNQKNIDLTYKVIDIADLLVQEGSRAAPETIAHVRDIVNNPQDLSTKLSYYKSKGFSFKEMKIEIDTILSYVGVKFKHTDLLPGEMSRLMDETKTLQAILQIFRYFKRGMPLAYRLFEQKSIDLPPHLNFESMSNIFMKMVDERYPSSEKVFKLASSLSDKDSALTSEHIKIIMLIILLNLIRDAIREVSPHKVYRSLQHRDDLYLAIIEALEDLEDALEDIEEQETEEDEEEEKRK